MSDAFRFPVSLATALDVNQPSGDKKPPEDIEADLNYDQQYMEDFFSQVFDTSSAAAAQSSTVADFYADVGNVGTGEDDLFTKTLPASTLSANGVKLFVEVGGIFVGSATATRQLKLFFGGTAIFTSGALAISAAASWALRAMIIRVSVTTIRYAVTLETQNAPLAAYTTVGELGSLTLGTTQIVKVTGEAAGVGAATDDIVARLGSFWTLNAA